MTTFRLLALAGSVALAAAPALAQPAPMFNHTIRFIVPFPPGGTLDVLARSISTELGEALGQPVIVDNRPGASGVIGAQAVAHAPPDGHTIFIASNTLVTLPAMRSDLPFDVFKDFAPVILMGATPTVLAVHPSFPARNFKDFVSAARARPGGVNYDSPGIGSPPHIAGELLARAANIPFVHVPYNGSGPALSAVLSNQVPATVTALNLVLPFIKDQQLYAIAFSDATRTKYLPDVPTLHEEGLTNMPAVSSWFAILATGGSPPDVVQRLNTEIAKILQRPEVQQRLDTQTFEIKPGSAEELAALMRNDAAVNARIVKKANIKAQ